MQTLADIACIGDSCVDVYLDPMPGSFLGGNAVNTAISASQAGLRATYAGVVGDDRAGKTLLRRLRARQIDTRMVRIHSAPTNRCYIRLLPGGRHEYVHELNPPRLPLSFSTENISAINRHRLVHANWLWPQFAAIPAFRLNPDLIVSIDYGQNTGGEFLDRSLPFTRIAFFSLPEQRAGEAQALAENIFGRGPRLVVVTLGSQGSLAFDGQTYHQPAEPVLVRDLLGAGDALAGAFLAAYLNGLPVAEALAAGARAAAVVCAIQGGWPGARLDEPKPARETTGK